MAARLLSPLALIALLTLPLAGHASTATASQPLETSPAEASSVLIRVTTVVDSGTVAPGSFDAVRVTCPRGTVAVGGGIDLDNVLTMVVTSSGPTFAETQHRLISQPDGTNPAPNGWQASARNNDTQAKSFKVAAICAHLARSIFLPVVNRSGP